ncbi:hypothetical protein [Roseimicrobium sp. ORNL1]|uniref:hypothetical protein n=1 Tax=Roseimicrobium sp. ORNL1 TaxID=2711231 RepID=UPI0013E17188|nr:hypothetical protein [Roseimicrobium sp. ORNL1]QIF02573.1 hypothetical protein G5S37_13915 [Roseimicrobium sp. ORNL1]
MNEEAPAPKKTRLTFVQVMVALLALALLASLAVPTFGRTCARGNITKGISNCRQIITAMRIYSSDHGGEYPDATLTDPQSSNEAFRVLFTENILDNELIFGCPISRFVPDGNIGGRDDPARKSAVDAGENHWAMTRDLTDSAPGGIPLVYENPAKPTWPPVWNADAKGTNARGRAWSNGVIVGLNDSSVGIQPLESKSGTAVPLRKTEGKDLFEAAINPTTLPTGAMLDVEGAP